MRNYRGERESAALLLAYGTLTVFKRSDGADGKKITPPLINGVLNAYAQTPI